MGQEPVYITIKFWKNEVVGAHLKEHQLYASTPNQNYFNNMGQQL